jgi:hypothetical protein
MLNFNGLHGVIFQKTKLFITTAVKISVAAGYRTLTLGNVLSKNCVKSKVIPVTGHGGP